MASERACVCLTTRFDVLAGMDFNVAPGERRKGLLFFVLWRRGGYLKAAPIGNECLSIGAKAGESFGVLLRFLLLESEF